MRSELRTFLGGADITQLGTALPQARRACQAKINLIGPCPSASYVKIQVPLARPAFPTLAVSRFGGTTAPDAVCLLWMRLPAAIWNMGLRKSPFEVLL